MGMWGCAHRVVHLQRGRAVRDVDDDAAPAQQRALGRGGARPLHVVVQLAPAARRLPDRPGQACGAGMVRCQS